MASCAPFPVRHNTDPVYYATNVVLIPILFGVGFMGNLVIVMVSNRATLRKENTLFVYICGLAVVDGMTLLLTTPRALQDMEILPANVTYSQLMAYASIGGYIFGNIMRNTSLWLTVIIGLMGFTFARKPHKNSRWTQNSTSRIMVFAITLVCIMLNFPRFMEVEVYEVKGHCFSGMSLWHWEVSSFGSQYLYQVVYPWVTTGMCYVLPMSLILLAILLLWHLGGWKKLPTTKMALVNANTADERHYSLLKTVWVVMCVVFAMEFPRVVYLLLQSLVPEIADHQALKALGLISNCLSLLHSAVIFIFLSIFCSDFRRALRRTLCCLSADEYYEPMCCSRRHGSKRNDTATYGYVPAHTSEKRASGAGQGRIKAHDSWVSSNGSSSTASTDASGSDQKDIPQSKSMDNAGLWV